MSHLCLGLIRTALWPPRSGRSRGREASAYGQVGIRAILGSVAGSVSSAPDRFARFVG
jgi:hypothetical protein